jgi:phosphatidylserine/phosphatidylglycerophosphate/cardiolipin synthase-like enzyme
MVNRKFLWATMALVAVSLFSYGTEASSSEPVRAATEVYFSPEDHVDTYLISMIERESASIKAAVYCLMHRGIVKALHEASQRGVDVKIIVDPFSTSSRSPLRKVAEKGLEVLVWDADSVEEWQTAPKKGKEHKPFMHDKFCIFGDHTVWTGSFNFTYDAAHKNRENVVVLHDPAVVALYQKEFEKLQKEGCHPYQEFLNIKKQKKNVIATN